MREPSFYRALLWCYPAAFRQEYGEEMLYMFSEQLGCASRFQRVILWARAAIDAATIGPKEHAHVMMQDLNYSWRTMAANPGFAAVAILSLSLGIGANTAIFSVWNRVLFSALPVRAPEQLVILTNPDHWGVSVGSQNGERSLLTYAEFEQLRDHADGFSGLMASESRLSEWPARVESGSWTEVRGRLVSGTYFELLGVKPLLGRFFTAADDRRDSPYAVVSYDYWQRSLGGRPDVLGKAITIRKAPLTIIGVAPPDFTGETVGQSPDLWVSMRMQQGVVPGRDRLHDTGPEKVMWLHVFGRLKDGVSVAQAQASANAVFQNGLKSYYGALLSPERAREYLEQKITLRPAAGGASNVRRALADPLKVLMAAVGVVLLIACCNLANLLLARGAARQREIALRLSLGASRARLVRQLLTESLVLASAGGVAGLAMAYALNRGLVRLMAETDETLKLGFGLEPLVLLFSFGVTVAAAVVFGVLPALLSTRADAGEAFKGQSRATSGSVGQLRWGRMLVALQLALSLPLLAGAGLLIRTLSNLQNVDLGYARERLAVARVDAAVAGYELHQREPLLRRILDEIKRIPGVRAATYSENGLFSGSDSGDEIEVEGYTRNGKGDRGSRWDQVGPEYFTTVGVPILMGRDINEGDHAAAPKVCVVNEAFAKKFFANRNPIGMHITTIYGDVRRVHQVVGVAKNSRTHRLRGVVDPRYFAPLTQPLGDADGAVFLVRTAGDPAPVLKALHETIRRTDPAIGILHLDVIEDRVNRRVSQDRIMARLAACFGIVAILLSALGLYGVLSFGVTRRRVEIGIRIALGAEPKRVVSMILREASVTILAGLVIGAGLAFAGTAFIQSQLYGLEPNDPVTLGAALALLVAIALTAAYLPARQASRVEPMTALRQD
jgi:predicted permease